jgi:hypothetical protein
MASKLLAEDLDTRALDYDYFVKNTYSTVAVLKSYIKGFEGLCGAREKNQRCRVGETDRNITMAA